MNSAIRSISVSDVRQALAHELMRCRYTVDKTGVRTVELVGVSFITGTGRDDESLFGEVNRDYVRREIAWYESESLRVADIPGEVPAIWTKVAARDGTVNSNYGWCLYSAENGSQYLNVKDELERNPFSRRAVAIYTRPSMHVDHCRDGMSDFMCTSTVQYMIRDGRLHVIVCMRSNDAVFGYRNDLAWQVHVRDRLAAELAVEPGPIVWQVGSLHVYERHFYLVDHYSRTGERSISIDVYRDLYPDSEWAR